MNINTLRKVLVTLGQIFNYAVRHRYLDYNPLRQAERPRDRHNEEDQGQNRITILAPGQIKRLLDEIEDQKHRTLVMLAIFSGVREGELLALKWRDLDMKTNQVHVQRIFTKGQFFSPKTRMSNRKIDLGPTVMKELRKWKLACPVNELDLMFPNESGKPMNYSNMVQRHF